MSLCPWSESRRECIQCTAVFFTCLKILMMLVTIAIWTTFSWVSALQESFILFQIASLSMESSGSQIVVCQNVSCKKRKLARPQSKCREQWRLLCCKVILNHVIWLLHRAMTGNLFTRFPIALMRLLGQSNRKRSSATYLLWLSHSNSSDGTCLMNIIMRWMTTILQTSYNWCIIPWDYRGILNGGGLCGCGGWRCSWLTPTWCTAGCMN